MLRRLILLVILFGLLGTHAALAVSIRVSPEMELLAGVLSQTTWIENRGPSGPGNEYFQALKNFFAEYKDHQAVAIAQNLSEKGFTYDAPPAFICHLGPLPDLDVIYEYSDYVVSRAGGREVLEEFRFALADLAREADFPSFFAAWQPYLEDSLKSCRQGFRGELVEDWLSAFFGWTPAEFHLIMAPSMFPGGGYGATVSDGAGDIAFQIIRENGSSQGRPEFPSGMNLEHLAIHEWGHSFVNPSLAAYPNRARSLRPLFVPVREAMRAQAYLTVATFLNEQVLRAVELRASQDLFQPETGARILESHESRGFYLTNFVAEQLEYYQANRTLYPTFRDFVPYLYDQLDLYAKDNTTWKERFLGWFLR